MCDDFISYTLLNSFLVLIFFYSLGVSTYKIMLLQTDFISSFPVIYFSCLFLEAGTLVLD